ncbi:MAG: DUF5721 family protein [Eubacterium sp.]|nr:DUF5721 family protein [Eubacterium sp.]
MKKLLMTEAFDKFRVMEIEIKREYDLNIDGKDLPYERLRPLMYQHLKGSELPHKVRVIFKSDLSDELKERLGASPDTGVGALVLRVQYEEGALQAVTGVSYDRFSPDKDLENAWDKMSEAFIDGLVE